MDVKRLPGKGQKDVISLESWVWNVKLVLILEKVGKGRRREGGRGSRERDYIGFWRGEGRCLSL